MILKDTDDRNEIEGYPVINQYKYLDITIDNKMENNYHVVIIDKKLSEYFTRNYLLNKIYFSVKSIIVIFGYFHKSRLLYGLHEFIDQNSQIERIDILIITNIKKLLKLPLRINIYNRLKSSLGLPDLNTYLIFRLQKLKDKYEYIFNIKLKMYDKLIKEILHINEKLSNVHFK